MIHVQYLLIVSSKDPEQNKRASKKLKSLSVWFNILKQTMAVLKKEGWKHGETDEQQRSSFEKTFTNSSIY